LQPVRDRIQAALARPRLSAAHRSQRRALDADAALVSASDLFDADWYLNRYPDLKGASLSPLEHYVRLGAYEGRDPGPGFNAMAYHRDYPEVAQSRQAALMHYLRFGKNEGRKIHPAQTRR
jgi:hypothetical protein